jgi:Flp pilus assembly protein TadG
MCMEPIIHRPRRAIDRNGTTVVETAFVLPVFMFFVLSIIEFGHAQMVINVLQSACRNGARIGTTEGTTTTHVLAKVDQTLSSAFETATVDTFVLDASVFDTGSSIPTGSAIEAMPSIELADAEPRQMFVVRATVLYNDIALVPMPFMNGVVLDGQAIMRHE